MSDTRKIAEKVADRYIGDRGCAPHRYTELVALVDEALRNERESKWLPLETAPRDKTYIIIGLINKSVTWRVSEAAHNGLGWYDKGGKSCHWATHWMPLPAAPPPLETPKEK